MLKGIFTRCVRRVFKIGTTQTHNHPPEYWKVGCPHPECQHRFMLLMSETVWANKEYGRKSRR